MSKFKRVLDFMDFDENRRKEMEDFFDKNFDPPKKNEKKRKRDNSEDEYDRRQNDRTWGRGEEDGMSGPYDPDERNDDEGM